MAEAKIENDLPTIAFQVARRGALVRIASREQLARYIREGMLHEDDWVIVYRGDESEHLRAGDVPEVRAVFAAVLRPAPAVESAPSETAASDGGSAGKRPVSLKVGYVQPPFGPDGEVAARKPRQRKSRAKRGEASSRLRLLDEATAPAVEPPREPAGDAAAAATPEPKAPYPRIDEDGLRVLGTMIGPRFGATDGKTFDTREEALDYQASLTRAARGEPAPDRSGEGASGGRVTAGDGTPFSTREVALVPMGGPAISAEAEREASPIKPVWIFVAIIVGLLMIAMCSTVPRRTTGLPSGEPSPTTTPDEAVTTDAPVTANAPSLITPEEVAGSETFFAVRDTNVRPQPNSASASITMLQRAAELRGVFVLGRDSRYRWLKITNGPHAGYFVAESNLSGLPRPSLDTEVSGPMAVLRNAAIYREANRNSAITQEVGPGTQLNVVGAVGDGMFEIMLRNGAVGYVDGTAFDRASDEPSITSTPPVPTSSPGTTVPYSTPRAIPRSTPPVTPRSTPYSAPYPAPTAPVRPQSSSPPILLSGGSMSRNSDYPDRAARAGQQGDVRFVVEVDSRGQAMNCRITQSSGHSVLDREACRLFQQRARFQPAQGPDGKPTPGIYYGQWHWRLQD